MSNESHNYPSNVEADQTAPNSAVQPVPQCCPPPEEPSIPIFEVAFRNGMWWSMPAELSMLLFEKYNAGDNAGYT